LFILEIKLTLWSNKKINKMDTFKKIQLKLPIRYNLPQRVAERLNAKGIKTQYGKDFNYHNVIKATNDENVISEAALVLLEYKATTKKVEKIAEKALK
jgi:hypothetical protein